MKHIAAALVAAQLGGCSYMFSHPPAPVRPGHPVEPCSSSRLAPAIDTYQAVGNGILALTMLSLTEDSSSMNGDSMAATMGVLGLAFAGIHGASAIYGFKQARACREQQAYLFAPQPVVVPVVPAEEEVPLEAVEIEEETDIHTTIKTRTRIRPLRE